MTEKDFLRLFRCGILDGPKYKSTTWPWYIGLVISIIVISWLWFLR